MALDKTLVARVDLGIGNLPWKAPKDHAHENDGDAPDVRLAGIILGRMEDLWGEVWVRADDARGESEGLAGIMKNGRSSKVDQFDNVIGSHDAIVQFEVAMCETHSMEIVDRIANLAKYTVDFWTTHAAGHYDAKEVIGGVLHDLWESSAGPETVCRATHLVIVAVVRDNVDSVYNVCVFESAADAKLCGDLFLVLLFGLALPAGPKLLYGIDGAAILCAGLYEADGSAGPRAKDLAPLAVLFGQMGLGGL